MKSRLPFPRLAPMEKKGLTYRKAGVDIDAGEKLVEYIKRIARPRGRKSAIGGFGAPVELPAGKKTLVASTDGVGTKLLVAKAVGVHSTVGIDLVAMCANDILCCGARPLFFLDYLAADKLDLRVARQVVKGVVRGCREAGCELIGGETAELPGMYPPATYDLAGFCVGLVENRLGPERVEEGDVLVGFRSNGLHSNGFSLVRRVFSEDEMRGKWRKRLLAPTRIYVRELLPFIRKGLVKALAHITGGGIPGNVPRILPGNLGAQVVRSSWKIPGIFREIQRRGGIQTEEIFRVFNMGLGMIAVVAERDAPALVRKSKQARLIGRVVRGAGVELL